MQHQDKLQTHIQSNTQYSKIRCMTQYDLTQHDTIKEYDMGKRLGLDSFQPPVVRISARANRILYKLLVNVRM